MTEEIYEDLLLADGFDEAFIGVGRRCGQPNIAVYDSEKCIEVLQKGGDMTEEEAMEYFEFNVVGAWVGDHTPMFVELCTISEVLTH